MTAFYPHTENLLVPLAGICILLVLGLAAYMEPKKDYSRRIYLFMLYSCAFVLLAECAQWYLEFAAPIPAPAALYVTMFIFYGMLVILCWCWTRYAYYWFNGHAPAGRAAAVFAVGPACEMILLIVNFFTGIVYSVSVGGDYARGSLFAVYIGFSYAFLLSAIIVTALSAFRRNGRGRCRTFGMFFFCFLLSHRRSAAQNASLTFPDGITEAFASLIVYMSIQQRTTAQYAWKRHAIRTSTELRGVAGAAAGGQRGRAVRLRLNSHRGTFSGERGSIVKIAGADKTRTISQLRDAFAASIRIPAEAAEFLALSETGSLLARFANQQTQLSMTYHRRVDNGESHLIRVFMNMLKNPGSGDIEGILYSTDIDRQDKEEKVVSALTRREYDYVALIDVEEREIHREFAFLRSGAPTYLETGGYGQVMERVLPYLRDPAEPGTERDKLAFPAVLDALNSREEYSYVFDCTSPSGKALQKKFTYRYLDETRTEILFFESDITAETRQERERSAMLQKALREIRHADAMKSEFLSNVSHDMRTPLNAVLGYTHLARTAADAAQTAEYLEKIEQAGNILLSLINDTLDLSKIESGDVILKPTPNLYDKIIDKVVALVRPEADRKRICFTEDGSRAAQVPVLVDALRLQEILFNLLSNAVKFTPENGRVDLSVECVRLEEHTAHDKIVIRDTGCGMRPEFLPKMYEPFSQERQMQDTVGSGLGLTIVKKLVDMMNGRIEVQSEAGRGTVFTLWFDFERAGDLCQTPEHPDRPGIGLRGRRILLAEDNAMNAEIARTVLEAQGMTVTCAENGEEACRIFAQSRPGDYDAILMDIRMPVMNGRDAARSIRKMERPDAAIPILAMSADAFDDDIRESRDAGMDGHISKPFQPEKLYAALAECIQKSSLPPRQ